MVDWKIVSTIFILLFIIENLSLGYGFYLINQEDENTDICYYDICSSNDDAYYETNSKTCVCYNYDLSNELNEVERVSIK